MSIEEENIEEIKEDYQEDEILALIPEGNDKGDEVTDEAMAAFLDGAGDGDLTTVDRDDLIDGEEDWDDSGSLYAELNGEAEEEIEEDLEAEEEEEVKEVTNEEEVDTTNLPPAVAAMIQKLTDRVDAAEHTAKSAAGRASKVQREINEAPRGKPSRELIRSAMTDKESAKKLKEDWPDHHSAMEELMDTVGDKFDKTEENISARIERQFANQEMILEISLAHSDWKTVGNDEKFINWVYEGGPSLTDRIRYEQLRDDGDPRSSQFYQQMLENNPKWAENKGHLFNTNTSEATITLLDKFKGTDIEQKNDIKEERRRKAERARRLKANIPASKGRNVGSSKIKDQDAEVNEAFESGFNNSQY
jgi:hypothetical protein